VPSRPPRLTQPPELELARATLSCGLPAAWLPRRRPRRPPELEEAIQHFLILNIGPTFFINIEMLIQHFYKMLKNIGLCF
jgi:hypothetical protein